MTTDERRRRRTWRALTVGCLGVLVVGSAALASDLHNTLTLDNRSGEHALVKVVGPTFEVVEVPSGTQRTVRVGPGAYYLLVRYGKNANGYAYSRGDEFRMTETQTRYTRATITLYKVVDGNYRSRESSAAEFRQAGSATHN